MDDGDEGPLILQLFKGMHEHFILLDVKGPSRGT